MLTRVDGRRDEDAEGSIGIVSAGEIYEVSLWSVSLKTKMKTTGTETTVKVVNGLEDEGGIVGAWRLSEMGGQQFDDGRSRGEGMHGGA